MHHILFPITYECNLSCKFCAAKNSKTIDIDLSIEALKEKTGQVEWIYITGGEPFLIEDLPAICDRIKTMGFKVGVTTNGTIFRPEIADHVDRMGISLDGDKKYHDTYRGGGVFDKALELFYAVKRKCETVIMSVAFKENQEALKKLEPIIEQMDPTYWQIQRDIFDPDVTIPVQI
jgi:MoaA/NifB/PqqE/SkfB family radical SAM enzyme